MFKTLTRGWIWLTASRKRFSFALSLALVGLLLWSRLIMLSNLPRTAVADDEVTPPNARPTTVEGDSSDKHQRSSTQEKPEKRPNDAPHASSQDETDSVSNSFQDERMFREEGK